MIIKKKIVPRNESFKYEKTIIKLLTGNPISERGCVIWRSYECISLLKSQKPQNKIYVHARENEVYKDTSKMNYSHV